VNSSHEVKLDGPKLNTLTAADGKFLNKTVDDFVFGFRFRHIRNNVSDVYVNSLDGIKLNGLN